MIGRIELTSADDVRVEAILGDDLVWTCPDPDTAEALNTVAPPARSDPALGWPAGNQFLRGARLTHATVLDEPVHPDYGPGVAY